MPSASLLLGARTKTVPFTIAPLPGTRRPPSQPGGIRRAMPAVAGAPARAFTVTRPQWHERAELEEHAASLVHLDSPQSRLHKGDGATAGSWNQVKPTFSMKCPSLR